MRKFLNIARKKYMIFGLLALILNIFLFWDINIYNSTTTVDFKSDEQIKFLETPVEASINFPEFLLHFEETDRAVDSTGNENNGEFGEAETQNSYILGSPTSNHNGIVGNCLEFDASNSDIVTWNDGISDEGLTWFSYIEEFSIMVWIKPGILSDVSSNHDTENCFISKASDNGNDNFELGIEKDANGVGVHYLHLYLDTRGGDTKRWFGSSTVNIKENKWNFIAFTYHNTEGVEVYIYNEDGEGWFDEGYQHDNIGAGTDDPWSAELDTAPSAFAVGGTHHSNIYYDGLIDEISMYSILLSQEEIENYAKSINTNLIKINNPQQFQISNQKIPDFNIEVKMTNIHKMWYTLDGGLNDITFTENGTINQTEWDKLEDGAVKITFHANDTYGNETKNQVTVYKDTSGPSYSNLIVSDIALLLGNTETISIDVTDISGINQTLISFEGSNHTMSHISGDRWQYISWTPSSVGNHIYTIWMEDDNGYWNYVEGSIQVIEITNPVFQSRSYTSASKKVKTLTLPHAIPGGDDKILVVFIGLEGDNSGVTTCKYGDTSLTYLSRVKSGKKDGCLVELWYMVNPPAGTDNVFAMFKDEDPSFMAAISYEDVNQDDPFGAHAGTYGISNEPEIYITTTRPNSLIIGSIEAFGGDMFPFGPYNDVNERYDFATGPDNKKDAGCWGGDMIAETPQSHLFGATANVNDDWAILAAELRVSDYIPPAYSNLIESDDPLELGDTETISIDVVDLMGINQVLIEFSGSNHSMSFISGDTWQYNTWTPSSVGIHPYKIWMEDNSGNWNQLNDSIQVIDTIAPTSSLSFDPAYSDGMDYVTSSTQFIISAIDDPGSGVALTYYKIGTGSWTDYSEPFDLSEYSEGSYTIYYISIDNEENIESIKSTAVYLDKEAPSSFLWFTPAYSEEIDYITTNTQFMISANDGTGSGVTSPYYRIGTGSWIDYSEPFDLSGYSEGSHTIYFTSIDNVGNAESINSTEIYLDIADPTTTLSFISDFTTNYVNGTTVFTINCDDGSGSGTLITRYKIDSDSWNEYTSPFDLSAYGDGSHVISFYSIDNVGNVEITNSIQINLYNELSAPTTNIDYVIEHPSNYVNVLTSFTIDSNDGAGSGVAMRYYQLDGTDGPWMTYSGSFTIASSDHGSHTIYFYSVDNVGNYESYKSVTIYLDKNSPITSINYVAAYPSNYINGTTLFSLSALDISGSGSAISQYKIDSGGWIDYVNPFDLNGESYSTHSIHFRSIDNVGNIEEFKSIMVYLDNNAPTTSINYDATYSPNFVTELTIFTLSASDGAGSGVAEKYYQLEGTGGPWTIYSGSFTIASSDHGSHTIFFYSVDNMGNGESYKSVTIYLDKEAPMTSINYVVAYPSNYVNEITLFSLSTDDNSGSGCAIRQYKIDTGGWIEYINPFDLSEETQGTHLIYYRSIDNVGNTEDFKSITVYLDNNAPTTSINYDTAYSPNYVTSLTSFSISANDGADSGVAEIYYQLDSTDGSWMTYSAPFTIASSDHGSHTIFFYSVDNVGNGESYKSITIYLDKEAPITSINYVTAYPSNFITETTVFSLSADDNSGSGCAIIQYRIDTGGWIDYMNPFDLSGETQSTHSIYYRSIDNIGNLEDFKSIIVYLDNNAPTTSINYDAEYSPNYVNSMTIFTLSANDGAGSGVAEKYYQLDGIGGSWTKYNTPFTIASSDHGSHTIFFYSVDNVGIGESYKSVTIYLDKEAPMTSINYIAAYPSNFIIETTIFSLSADDNSGSGCAIRQYRIDSGGWIDYSNPFDLSGESYSTHSIHFRSIDNVGNTEEFNSITVYLDNNAPTTSINYDTAYSPNYVIGLTSFSLFASDGAGSGVAEKYYQLDGIEGSWIKYSTPFTIASSAQGSHTIYFYSEDNVGIGESHKSVTIYLDKETPITNIEYNVDYPSNYVNKLTTFMLSGNDGSGSGIATRYYQLDGTDGSWMEYSGSFTIESSDHGSHTIYFYSVDNVGNGESYKSVTIYLDKEAPMTNINYVAAYPSNFITETTLFSLSADDNPGSGCAISQYRIDTGGWIEYINPFDLSGESHSTHSIYYRSIDNVGNTEEYKSIMVYLDKNAPITSINYDVAYASNYVNSLTIFTLSANDGTGSGVATRYYQLDGTDGSWMTYAGSFTIASSAQGSHTIYFYSEDNVGIRESHKSATIYLDKETPITNIEYVADYPSNYVKILTTFILSGNDGSGSGVAEKYYQLDGTDGSWMTYSGSFTLASSDHGSHTIYFYSVDNVGNGESYKSATIYLDKEAPITSINYIAAYPSNFITETTLFSLTIDDNSGSGCAFSQYMIDTGGWIDYTIPFDLSGESQSTHYIYFRSVDNVGNIEEYKSIMVYLDNSAPTTSINYDVAHASNYVRGTTTFTITGSDIGGSGVKTTYYQLDGTNDPWTTYTIPFDISSSSEGSHEIYFYSIDNVGNIETSGFISVILDSTSPTTNIDYTIAYPSDYIKASTSFSLISNDGSGSGVATRYYQLDGTDGSWMTYRDPFSIASSDHGSHTIFFYSVDNVGNEGSYDWVNVYFDKNDPITSLKFDYSYTPDYVNSSTQFSLSASDNLGSGISTTAYQIDGGLWQDYNTPFILSGEGMHWICYNSTDNVDNIENYHNKTVYLYDEIDAPITNINFVPVHGSNYINDKTLITLTSNDGNGAGVSHIYYKIDNGSWMEYTTPFTLLEMRKGTHTIHYYSIDKVGNDESSRSIAIILILTNADIPNDENDEDSPFVIIIPLLIVLGIIGGVGVFVNMIRSKSKSYTDKSSSSKFDQFTNAESSLNKLNGYTSNSLVNSCINDLLTKFCNGIGNWYYTEAHLYSDIHKKSDGLILNYGSFLQNRLAASEGLAEDLSLDPNSLQHIKAIQIFYVTDLSEENLKRICLEYQTPDILNIIVGLHWLKFQYDEVIEPPHDKALYYRDNCRIIKSNLFIELIGLDEKTKKNFERLIGYSLDSNFLALNKFKATQKVLAHHTEDLRDDLVEMGYIKRYFDEYFEVW